MANPRSGYTSDGQQTDGYQSSVQQKTGNGYQSNTQPLAASYSTYKSGPSAVGTFTFHRPYSAYTAIGDPEDPRNCCALL